MLRPLATIRGDGRVRDRGGRKPFAASWLAMEIDFNPYREWLGIAADEQPPDYYCLLGIPRFESDRALIASASTKRIALLSPHKNGERARHGTEAGQRDLEGHHLPSQSEPQRDL